MGDARINLDGDLRSNHCRIDSHPEEKHQTCACNRIRGRTRSNDKHVSSQPNTRGSIVDVHSKSDAYSFPQGTPLPHKHTKKCGFDRTGSHSLNTYVCECGWHEDSDGYILERERDEMA